MICDNCNRSCRCPRRLHTGEGRVLIGLTKNEIEYLLAVEGCESTPDVYRRLEQALELLR